MRRETFEREVTRRKRVARDAPELPRYYPGRKIMLKLPGDRYEVQVVITAVSEQGFYFRPVDSPGANMRYVKPKEKGVRIREVQQL